jgi:dihydroxyacetone kinase
MYNDSIETLLLRHYGSVAPAPPHLEQQLAASLRQEVSAIQRQERIASRLRTHHISRRKAVRLVAIGSAGIGLLSAGLEGLHMLESALVGQDTMQPARSTLS